MVKLLNSTEFVTIFAAILGATVGGIISYLTTTRSLIKSNQIKSAVINKKTIYEPLLIEFKNLYKDIKENDVIYLSLDSNFRTIGSTQFEVWTRIKKDSRFFQIPDYLKSDLMSFEKKIFDYLSHLESIKNNAMEFFERQLKNIGYSIEQNREGIKSCFDIEKLIQRKEDLLLTDIFKHRILGLPVLSEEEIDLINKEFNIFLLNTSDIPVLYEKKRSVIKSLEELIKLLEKIIIKITNKYERQSNLF